MTHWPTQMTSFTINDLNCFIDSLIDRVKLKKQVKQSSLEYQITPMRKNCHLLPPTALFMVSLILDFRMSQIFAYSSLYFLAYISNMLARSTNSRLLFSASLSTILIWIIKSPTFLFTSATYILLLSICCLNDWISCSLSLYDLPIMLSFSEISLFSLETK